MRCLIPVHQEIYPENSLRRVERICDEAIILYVVDRRLIERAMSESSYIIPSYTLDTFENFVVEIHRAEANKIKDSIKNIPVDLRFVVGDYYKSVEKEAIRASPDLIMCDDYQRILMNFDVPLWIDRGMNIREATFIISNLLKIRKVKRDLEFLKDICKKLKCSLYLHSPSGDYDLIAELGNVTREVRGELLVLQKGYEKMFKNWKGNLLFL